MNPYDFYITPDEYAHAEALGISRNRLSARIRQFGWSKSRALSTPPLPMSKHTHWRNIALSNGVCSNTFYSRIKAGWDMEVAATTSVLLNTFEIATNAKRKYPKELLELAKENGISRATFYSRVRDSGWDAQRAATERLWTRSEIGKLGKERFLERYGFTQPHPDYHESKEDEYEFYKHPEGSDDRH